MLDCSLIELAAILSDSKWRPIITDVYQGSFDAIMGGNALNKELDPLLIGS
jgi:hypothetical protein